MQPVPIIIPVSHNSEEDKCPNCGKPEDIKQVCKHCGHEYPEDDEDDEGGGWSTFFGVIIFIAVIIVICWIFLTFIVWIAGDDTLVNVIKSQYHWFVNLMHRIY